MKDVDLRRIVAEVTREVAAQADRGSKPSVPIDAAVVAVVDRVEIPR